MTDDRPGGWCVDSVVLIDGSGDAELCTQRQTTALHGPDVDEQRTRRELVGDVMQHYRTVRIKELVYISIGMNWGTQRADLQRSS